MLIKLGYHLSILLVFWTFPHPTSRLLVAPGSAAGVFFWSNWLQVSCAAVLALFPSEHWVLVKSWHFCFQLLFSSFSFSCSAFVSSILVFAVGILFDIFVFNYYSLVLVFLVQLLFHWLWFLLYIRNTIIIIICSPFFSDFFPARLFFLHCFRHNLYAFLPNSCFHF